MAKPGGAGIDLLLTDLVMPGGISGDELAKQSRRERPALKVVYMSGYSVNVMGRDNDFSEQDARYLLQKPYHAHVLIETIRRCLDEVKATAG